MTLYDPLNYDNLMVGLTAHFERQAKIRIDKATGIIGPRIYTLYYDGNHSAYAKIAATEKPIYVRKTVPRGSRKALRWT